MKYFTKLTLAFSALLTMLGGCGESSNKTVFGNSSTDEVVVMEIDTPYTVNQGDKIVPDGPAQIVVDHAIDVDTKTVRILSGSARLLRGTYALK
jgi:hypothetical protein